MKNIVLQTNIQVFSSAEELAQSDQQLLLLARASLAQAYAPYSNFQVGAALLTASGKMIGGSNQENASYPLCLCAERVALSAAAVQCPGDPIVAIAVTAKSEKNPLHQPVSPCGACRQVICETEYRYQQDIKIIMQGETGEVFILDSGKALLPFSFSPEVLL